jgi:hypothetical protein
MKIIYILRTTLAMATILLATSCSKHGSQGESKTSPPKAESKPKLEQEERKPGVNVFSSFDAQNKYEKTAAWAVMNSSKNGYRGQAEWFVPTGSGPLNTVDLAMTGKGSVNITVAEDKNGLPGKTIESVLNVSSSHSHQGHLVLESTGHPVLNAGTKYWLYAEPANSENGCSWGHNNQNLAQGFADERKPGNWSFIKDSSHNGAFRINVVP